MLLCWTTQWNLSRAAANAKGILSATIDGKPALVQKDHNNTRHVNIIAQILIDLLCYSLLVLPTLPPFPSNKL